MRFGFGTNDESLTVDGVNVDLSIDKFMGVYLKYASTTTGKVSPYAILGYTHAKAEASALGVTVSASESEISFGVGVDFGLSEETSLNIEYMNFLDKSIVSVDGISVGFRAAL
jgi:opacity protein-like surface antigen